MSKKFKNNVTRLLESKKVPYTLHEYDYNAGIRSAVEVAQAINLPPEQVFKTLVALTDEARRKPLLAVIPGPDTLDLKAFAKQAKAKKIRMAAHEQAESLTKLQTGGISPLALINKGFEIYIEESAELFETIAVSVGQRGANVQLPVKDLINLTGARVISLLIEDSA